MAAKETMDTIEKTLDNIEGTLDVIEDTAEASVKVAKNNPVLLGVVAVAAFAGGATAGYFWAKKRLKLHYEEIATTEIAEARERYSVVRNQGYETPEAAVEALIDLETRNQNETLIDELEYRAPTQNVEKKPDVKVEVNITEEPERHNVLVNNAPIDTDDWDYEKEQENRGDPTIPYIIEHDEFFSAESGYDQSSLTYFSGDDVVVDARDEVIRDSDSIVGDDNLTRFGHGSRDENIVYIRNEKLETDFEVALSRGSYTVEVLGMESVIKHSDRRPGRKFRVSDDE